jgi:hypothetical protein
MKSLLSAIATTEAKTKAGFPKPPTVLPHIQNAFAAAFDGNEESESEEDLIPFLRGCEGTDLSELKRSELNRILRGAWISEEFDELGLRALQVAKKDPRSSSAKAASGGYSLHFPAERDAISSLASHCHAMTKEVVPQFQKRAAQFSLFDPTRGPAEIGKAMLVDRKNSISSACQEAGLGNDPFATKLGEKAFEEACSMAASLKAEAALKAQSEILELFKEGEPISNQPGVACALLEPWVEGSPPADHRKRVSALLAKAIGDPRLHSSRWKFIESEMQKLSAEYMPSAIVDVLKRWLTEAAMRTFFQAIAKTTDQPGQWKTRSDFWLAYLDNGCVEDAWPALGPRAREQIASIAKEQEEALEHGTIDGGPAGSSALILKIGDLTIAEWSDNGKCRIWNSGSGKSPEFYKKRYRNYALRSEAKHLGKASFIHDASGNWRYRVAAHIYSETGVEHPVHGAGYW